MTEWEFKTAARLIVEEALKALIAKDRERLELSPKGKTLSELNKRAKPSFPPSEAPKYARHFEADREGFYPGDLHTFFKLSVKEFAMRTGLVRARNYLPLESRWEIVWESEDMDI